MPAAALKQAENGVWYIHWTDGRRSKRKSTGTSRVDVAQAYFGQWLLMAREAPDDLSNTLTVLELWTAYVERHIDKNTSSAETFRYAWKNLEGHFGSLYVSAIDQALCDHYEKKRLSGAIGKPSVRSTVRRELNALISCLNWCAAPKRQLIPKASVPLIDLPPESEPRDRWLRIPEVQRLLKAAGDLRQGARLSRGERFLWLALETAAREAAIFDLTWDRVDFDTKVIHYDVPGRRKTKKRRASVPISKSLLPVLQRAHAERETELVLDNKGAIWPVIQRVALAAGFGDATDAYTAAGKPKATGISPHVLRHTAATHMARAGVPLWQIAGVLGNSMAMVEKVYAKHCPDGLIGAVNSISSGQLEAAE